MAEHINIDVEAARAILGCEGGCGWNRGALAGFCEFYTGENIVSHVSQGLKDNNKDVIVCPDGIGLETSKRDAVAIINRD